MPRSYWAKLVTSSQLRTLPTIRGAATMPILLGSLIAAAAGGMAAGEDLPPLFPTPPPAAKIPLPPLGWNSNNAYGADITDQRIIENARALKALVNPTGRKNGLYYFNIDAGWFRGKHDPVTKTRLFTDEDKRRFPRGMAAVAKDLRSLGFRPGIYTDIGKNGCWDWNYSLNKPGGYPSYNDALTNGSYGYYDEDFRSFLEWGYEYVKVDWCGGRDHPDLKIEARKAYQTVAKAIWKANAEAAANPQGYASTKLELSICEWGYQRPWEWGAGLGWLWRTEGDFGPKPRAPAKDAPFDGTGNRSVYRVLVTNYHPEGQHTGYYNDGDMMMLGKFDWTAWQNRTHMSLWAIMGSPLIAGNRLWAADPGDAPNPADPRQIQKYPPELSGDVMNVLTNRYILAIDQDQLGLQGIRVVVSGQVDTEKGYAYQVWSKLLATRGRRAVLFLNRTKEGSAPADLRVSWKELGLDPATPPRIVTDVWGNGAGVKIADGSISVSRLPANNVVVLVIEGGEPAAVDYRATPENRLSFTKITSDGEGDYIRIAYVNAGAKGLKARMRVSSGLPDTTIFLPPTGGGVQAVTVYTRLKSGADNQVTFTADKEELNSDRDGPLPDIRALSIVAGPRETSP